MPDAPHLTCMAWDHPRALDPLNAISADWSASAKVEVSWVARPLKDFEDQPLEELARAYDLVLMDYPFTGTAAKSGTIVPVDDWVDADYLADQRRHSVGPSFASYAWGGRQWALAIDAACQVSAVRDDLWQSLHGELPNTWDDVAALAGTLSNGASRVAIPLNPNHAYSAFIAVGIGLAGPAFWPIGQRPDRTSSTESLRFLKALAADLHPVSRDADPIAVSDHMAETNEIVHVPLMYGYSSYARKSFRRHRLSFGNAPLGASGMRGSVLGGVGIALSALSRQRGPAADLARTIGAADVQAGLYVDSGGQPGHAAAWDSRRANEQTGGFFRATRATIDQAFVRPRVPGHRHFQPLAGERIHRYLWDADGAAEQCMQALELLYDRYLEHWGETGAGGHPAVNPLNERIGNERSGNQQEHRPA